MACLIPDFLGAGSQIVPGIGTIREPRLRPPVLLPVARIWNVGIGKSEITLGLWIVGRLVREVDLLAVLLLHFLVHMRHVNGLLLVGAGRRKQHQQVMSLLCRGLGGGFRVKVDKVDVINHHIRVMLLSPLLAEGAIEPGVVGRDEMTPLKYF